MFLTWVQHANIIILCSNVIEFLGQESLPRYVFTTSTAESTEAMKILYLVLESGGKSGS